MGFAPPSSPRVDIDAPWPAPDPQAPTLPPPGRTAPPTVEPRPARRRRFARQRDLRRPTVPRRVAVDVPAGDTAARVYGTSNAGRSAVISAVGTVVAMAAMIPARDGLSAAPWMLWAGLALAALPVYWYLLDPRRIDHPRPWLVMLLGVEMVLIKTAHSPRWFTLFDEMLHVRTLQDITSSGEFGLDHPALPVSPLFPGMEAFTATIELLTGLSWYASAVVVIVLARLVMVAALYALARAIVTSRFHAAIVAGLYIAHPNALFFHAQFAYETLAVPLAAMAIAVLARSSRKRDRRVLDPIVVVLMIAVVMTHHVTSFMLVGTLMVWALIAAVAKDDWRHVGAAAGLLAGLVGIWTIVVAPETFDYLTRSTENAVVSTLEIIEGTGDARRPFEAADSAAPTPSMFDRVIGIAGTIVQCGLVAFGALALWRQRRRNSLLIVLAIAAVGFPISVALRFVGDAWEIGARASAMLYLGVATAVAAVLVPFVSRRNAKPARMIALGTMLLILVGNAVIGTSATTRLPGPYTAGAGTRSVDAATVEAAEWLRETYGTGHRIVTDRTNTVVMGSYGRQNPVTDLDTDVTISPIFLAPNLEGRAMEQLERSQARFIVVELRNTLAAPEDGYYYESWERDLYAYVGGVPRERVMKFIGAEGFDLVYDNGAIVIFDTGIGADVAAGTPVEPDPDPAPWQVALRTALWAAVFGAIAVAAVRAFRRPSWGPAEDAGMAVAAATSLVTIVTVAAGVLGAAVDLRTVAVSTASLAVALLAMLAAGAWWQRRGEDEADDDGGPKTLPQQPARAPWRFVARVAGAVAVVTLLLGGALAAVRFDAVADDAPTVELGIERVDDTLVVNIAQHRADERGARMIVRTSDRVVTDRTVRLADTPAWLVVDLAGVSDFVTVDVEIDGEDEPRRAVLTVSDEQTIQAAWANQP